MQQNFLGIFSGPEDTCWAKEVPGGAPRGHNPPGHAWGPRRALVGCAHLGGLPPRLFALQIPQYSKNPRGVDETQFQPPQVPETPDPI
jgi:hypothetical protein